MKRPGASSAYGYCFLLGILLMGTGLATNRVITAIGIAVFVLGFAGISLRS